MTLEGPRSSLDSLSSSEAEPFPHYPILLLGAGSGLGQELARKFANEGYRVIAGTRSLEKFGNLWGTIRADGGVEPYPFVADIANPDQVRTAYESLGLKEGEKLHYMPVAAGGFERTLVKIGRQLIYLRKGAEETGEISLESAEKATAAIKAFTTSKEATDPAIAINCDAPCAIFDLLAQNGHLGPESVILTTSSYISDMYDPDKPGKYQGPWFYYHVAMSKAMGVYVLRERVQRIDASHIDFVIPEISDTQVGKFGKKIAEIIMKLQTEFKVPRISRAQVAMAMYRELTRRGGDLPKIRKVYVDSNGTNQQQRPESWKEARFPHL